MTSAIRFGAIMAIFLAAAALVGPARAQQTDVEESTTTTEGAAEATPAPESADAPAADAEEDADDAMDEIVGDVDRSRQAQQASAGVLRPIYALAQKLSFPAFHWVAFALMVAGVVSFALQLVLGKLVVLMRMGFSFTEILSDALGLAVSLIGLVLTTQAATENSTFTTSAFAVLSATIAGALTGFIFYLWGQRQELQAVEGRRVAATRDKASAPPPPRK